MGCEMGWGERQGSTRKLRGGGCHTRGSGVGWHRAKKGVKSAAFPPAVTPEGSQVGIFQMSLVP